MNSEIRVGDYVRSYDFHGRGDCYVEGVVLGVDVAPGYGVELDREDGSHYAICVERRVVENKEVVDQLATINIKKLIAYPPVNGMDGIFGVTEGVVKLVDREELKGV